MRAPRMSLMRQMKPGDSVLIRNGPTNTGDVLAQSIGSHIGGKWHTRRVSLIEGDRVIQAVILTCAASPNPVKKRGRPRKVRPVE